MSEVSDPPRGIVGHDKMGAGSKRTLHTFLFASLAGKSDNGARLDYRQRALANLRVRECGAVSYTSKLFREHVRSQAGTKVGMSIKLGRVRGRSRSPIGPCVIAEPL